MASVGKELSLFYVTRNETDLLYICGSSTNGQVLNITLDGQILDMKVRGHQGAFLTNKSLHFFDAVTRVNAEKNSRSNRLLL